MKRYLLIALLALAAIPAWAASGIITTNGSDCSVSTRCLVVNLPQDKGGAGLSLSGTWTGTIQFEVTVDGGATWASASVTPVGSSTTVTSTTANGTWQINASGFTGIRMRASATVTGAATATITPSAASAKSNGGGGSGGTPGGSNTQVQYNNSGAFGGISGATSNGTTLSVTTQAANDNSTKAASTAYADRAVANGPATIACSSVTSASPVSGTCSTTLTASQVNGATSPVTLIAAQGANTFIDPIDIVIEYKHGSAAFAGSISAGFYLGYNDGVDLSWIAWPSAGFLDQATSQAVAASNFSIGGGGVTTSQEPYPLTDLANQPLILVNQALATTSGTGSTVTFFITYRIITFN